MEFKLIQINISLVMRIKLRKKHILLISSVILIFLSLIFFIQTSKRIPVSKLEFETRDFWIFSEEITRYPSKIEVLENLTKIGVSTDIDKIDFGRIAMGMKVRKVINVYNKNPFKVKVHIKPYGNISHVINTTNSFILNSFEGKNVSIEATGKEVGSFSGEISVIVRKPKFDWLIWIL